MANGQGPNIVPAAGAIGELQMQLVWDVDPDKFPDGVDIVVCAAGKLEPLAGVRVTRGAILAAMPPGPYANHLRAQMKSAQAAQQQQRKITTN